MKLEYLGLWYPRQVAEAAPAADTKERPHVAEHVFTAASVFPLQHSRLETPTDGGAWGAAVHGVAKSQTRLSNKHTHKKVKGGRCGSGTDLEKKKKSRKQESTWRLG